MDIEDSKKLKKLNITSFNTKLLILWGIVILAYGYLFIFAQPARMLRLSNAEKRAFVSEYEDIWCSHENIVNGQELKVMERGIERLRLDYTLTLIDSRMLIRKAAGEGWAMRDCFVRETTRTLCQELGLEVQSPDRIGTRVGLRPEEVRLILNAGIEQGIAPHQCIIDEGITP